MKQALKIITLILLLPAVITAQQVLVSGIVIDNENNEPLAFVNIISDDGKGAITDIDGKFSINIGRNNCCLRLSYIGYEDLRYNIDYDIELQQIILKSKIFNLNEVIIFPGENPAHRIINNVLQNRNLNDPKKLNSFSYTSYDKMIFTIDADSVMKMDTSLLDTNQMKVRQFFDKQYIFLMETVTERKYRAPGLNQENVLATRVSGLNDPVMAFMISQIQSTSFYDELIQLAGNDYINPISKGSINKYFFLITDTIYSENKDTTFIISFTPKPKSRFEGLEGFLHINSNRWAIQNVKAEPQNDSTGFRIKIQQGYEFIQNHWFPTQLNTDIVFNMVKASDGNNNYPLTGIGKSYIKDIMINPDISKNEFGFHEIEIEEGATNRKGEYWKNYRVDSLTQKELETYRVIDSIGKAKNFDKIASSFQTLITGQIPYKFINIDMDKFIHYNDYEGVYLGLGVHTNQKISKTFTVGGYWGYGFKDKSTKYGGDISVKIHRRSESVISLKAYNTVTVSGEVELTENNQIWRPDYFYKLFYSSMDKTSGSELEYKFRIRHIRDFKWHITGRMQKKTPFENYYFTYNNQPEIEITSFNTFDVTAGFRFAYREKILQTTKGQISLGSKFPIFWLNYTKGYKDFLDGDFDYDRVDVKVSYDHYFKYLGESNISVSGGFINGQIPISNLYRGVGSFSRFTIYAPNSFGTMGSSEFYSDKYVSIFYSHNFKNLLFGIGNFQPEIIIVSNIIFGSMSNKGNHHNITFNTLENGYYESGLIIRKLLNLQLYDLGAGVLYRYGAYGYNNASKNLAYKLSLYYSF
jgi:uncharacterized protein DUF5686/carboxypeptidase-like protein